ncbi:chondroitin AC/alginate lyase [Exidia glandulosa HHB12029]|uniref:Chondroitin AC/alginate lyase n=1 Tax=Exidia glandulosa HHB12029 TaxID=1314781 RepID=A0A165H288_EXIGL|nr:chondroitin AC/alginate lyase [Exidia glandulosa HHB12029]
MSLVRKSLIPLLAAVASVSAASASWNTFISYDNEFVAPEIILSKPWTKNNNTLDAAESIVSWADTLGKQGPWSVTFKPFTAPTKDKHDYLSWAPYWWPDCSGVGNKTELTQEEIWVTCPYKDRDGKFVPDVRLVNDTGSFAGLCDAVFYNAIAWQITDNEDYAAKAVEFIRTWYLDDDTYMNPNLNYSQVIRGPGVQVGNHYGVLDMKTTSKILTAILLFRKAPYAGWTAELDGKMVNWSQRFIKWLETHPFGKDEGSTPNNHGTYFYNTMVSHQIIAGNTAEAKRYLDRYFTTQYLAQIDANGEQPLEVIRSRTYHYRAYNLGAMITNGKLGQYIGYDAWNLTTTKGGTIQKALDWAMQFDPATTGEVKSAPAQELYQHVAAVGSVYGDPDGKYAAYLARVSPDYPQSPFYFWNQPLALPKNYLVTGSLPNGSNNTGSGGSQTAGGEGDGTGAAPRAAFGPALTLVGAVLMFQLARIALPQRV